MGIGSNSASNRSTSGPSRFIASYFSPCAAIFKAGEAWFSARSATPSKCLDNNYHRLRSGSRDPSAFSAVCAYQGIGLSLIYLQNADGFFQKSDFISKDER